MSIVYANIIKVKIMLQQLAVHNNQLEPRAITKSSKLREALRICVAGMNQFTAIGFTGYVNIVLLFNYKYRLSIITASTIYGLFFGKDSFLYNIAKKFNSVKASGQTQSVRSLPEKISEYGYFFWNTTQLSFSLLLTAAFCVLIPASFAQKDIDESTSKFFSYYPIASMVASILLAITLGSRKLLRENENKKRFSHPTHYLVKSLIRTSQFSRYFFFVVRTGEVSILDPVSIAFFIALCPAVLAISLGVYGRAHRKIQRETTLEDIRQALLDKNKKIDHVYESILSYTDFCAWVFSCIVTSQYKNESHSESAEVPYAEGSVTLGLGLIYGFVRYKLLKPKQYVNVQSQDQELQAVELLKAPEGSANLSTSNSESSLTMTDDIESSGSAREKLCREAISLGAKR